MRNKIPYGALQFSVVTQLISRRDISEVVDSSAKGTNIFYIIVKNLSFVFFFFKKIKK